MTRPKPDHAPTEALHRGRARGPDRGAERCLPPCHRPRGRALGPRGPPGRHPRRACPRRRLRPRGAPRGGRGRALHAGNDPHGEHDFGAVEVESVTVWWKLDLLDRELRWASPRPDDPEATARVLTVLMPEDW